MSELIALGSFFVVSVLYVLMDNYFYKLKIDKRLSAPLFKWNHYQGPIITPLERYDAYREKKRIKKLMTKLEYPTLKDYSKRIIAIILTFIIYKQLSGGGFVEHLQKNILIIVFITLFFLIMYYMIILPNYIRVLEAHLSGNIKILSYDIDSGKNLCDALVASRSYGHPEFIRVCEKIACLNYSGFSIKQSIERVIPGVKSEKLALFLVILNVHSDIGGNLSIALRNISKLYESQHKIQSRLARIALFSKFSLFVSIAYLPLVALAFDNKYGTFRSVFLESEKGFVLLIIIVVLYFISNISIIYLLKREKL